MEYLKEYEINRYMYRRLRSITNEEYQSGGADLAGLDVNDRILNPTLLIIPEEIEGDRTINVVRDGFLLGGTKQRMLGKFIALNSDCEEFVYAGPENGYAQVALSYIAHMYSKRATIFINKRRPRTGLTDLASGFRPKLMEIPRANLKKLSQMAEDYVEQNNRKGIKTCLVPFGLHTPELIQILADQIKKALPKNLEENHPRRMWVVAGSTTLLNALYKVFPNTYFLTLQVGKKVWPDQIDESRTTLYISDEKFNEEAKIQPPFPTVSTYDAKIWKYILEHGEDGDYAWMVGKQI